jgi:hypothetical protein
MWHEKTATVTKEASATDSTTVATTTTTVNEEMDVS